MRSKPCVPTGLALTRWFALAVLGLLALTVATGSRPVLAQATMKGGTAAPPSRPGRPGPIAALRVRFNAGVSLFLSGKIDEATLVFLDLHNRYPEHIGTKSYLARCYARSSKWDLAAKLFARVPEDDLDIETLFDYAMTLFHSRREAKALDYFVRIPKGHSFFDLARYHAGIASHRLQRWKECRDHMREAVALPERLAESRRAFAERCDKLIPPPSPPLAPASPTPVPSVVQSSPPPAPPPVTLPHSPQDSKAGPGSGQGPAAASPNPEAAASGPAPEMHTPGYSVGAEYDFRQVSVDTFAAGIADVRQERMNLKVTAVPAGRIGTNRFSHFYGLHAEAAGYYVTEEQIPQLALERRDELDRNWVHNRLITPASRVNPDNDPYALTVATLEPWFESKTPIGLHLGISAGARWENMLSDDEGLVAYRRWFAGGAAWRENPSRLTFVSRFSEIADADGALFATEVDTHLHYVLDTTLIRLLGAFEYWEWTYDSDATPGPTQRISGTLDPSLPFPGGFAAGLRVQVERHGPYAVRLESGEMAEFDPTAVEYEPYVVWSNMFVRLRASYANRNIVVEPGSEEAETDVKFSEVPERIDGVTLSASVRYQF